MAIYVAVVANQDITQSGRLGGDLASFIGDDKDDVIKKAIRAARNWENQYHSDGVRQRGPYRILVGKLTNEATTMHYELEDFNG